MIVGPIKSNELQSWFELNLPVLRDIGASYERDKVDMMVAICMNENPWIKTGDDILLTLTPGLGGEYPPGHITEFWFKWAKKELDWTVNRDDMGDMIRLQCFVIQQTLQDIKNVRPDYNPTLDDIESMNLIIRSYNANFKHCIDDKMWVNEYWERWKRNYNTLMNETQYNPVPIQPVPQPIPDHKVGGPLFLIPIALLGLYLLSKSRKR